MITSKSKVISKKKNNVYGIAVGLPPDLTNESRLTGWALRVL